MRHITFMLQWNDIEKFRAALVLAAKKLQQNGLAENGGLFSLKNLVSSVVILHDYNHLKTIMWGKM